jgi:hypothetical protein
VVGCEPVLLLALPVELWSGELVEEDGVWLAEELDEPGVEEVAPVVLDCELGEAAALLCEEVAFGVVLEEAEGELLDCDVED